MNKIRVMLVDDHAVLRSGLRRLLEHGGEIDVVAEAESGEGAYQIYGDHLPDIAVLDLSMPGMGGLEAVRKIIARYTHARILIFSMHENVAFASQALKAGVRGYLVKTGAPEELVTAVHEVMRGKTYLSPLVAQKLAMQSVVGDSESIHQLSAREFELLRLLAEGRGADEIGKLLNISQKTVANYHTLIKQKLGITTSVELIRVAMRHGLIEE